MTKTKIKIIVFSLVLFCFASWSLVLSGPAFFEKRLKTKNERTTMRMETTLASNASSTTTTTERSMTVFSTKEKASHTTSVSEMTITSMQGSVTNTDKLITTTELSSTKTIHLTTLSEDYLHTTKTQQNTTPTISTTTITTITTEQADFNIQLQNRTMKTVFIWGNSFEVVSASLSGTLKVRLIQKYELSNGHKQGRIEFVDDKRQWIWGHGELIELADNGTLFRITPHPSKVKLNAYFLQTSIYKSQNLFNCIWIKITTPSIAEKH